MMKTWKEIGKGAIAFAAWIVVLILLSLIDEAVGYLITGHDITKIMVQCIIQGTAVIVLLCMKAETITAIGLNAFLLLLMWILTEDGMAQSMAIIMMLGIVPVYLREKEGGE